jgi:predicted RNA-binding protein with EMAP domain
MTFDAGFSRANIRLMPPRHFMRFLLLGMNCGKQRLIVGKQCHIRAIFTVGSLPAFAA